MSHVVHLNEQHCCSQREHPQHPCSVDGASHTCQGVMSHMSTTFVTRMNYSRSNVSHSYVSHVAHTNATRRCSTSTPPTPAACTTSQKSTRLYVNNTILLVQYKTTKELFFQNVRQHYGALLALAITARATTKCTIQNHNIARERERHGAK